jgi:hypothetical protein
MQQKSKQQAPRCFAGLFLLMLPRRFMGCLCAIDGEDRFKYLEFQTMTSTELHMSIILSMLRALLLFAFDSLFVVDFASISQFAVSPT